jgi:hypothetical protein
MLTSIVPGTNSHNATGPESNTTQQPSKFNLIKEIHSSKSTSFPGSGAGRDRNPASKSGTFHGRKFTENKTPLYSSTGTSGGGGGILTLGTGSQSQTVDGPPQTSSRIRGKKANSNLQDLDKLLDHDAIALLNMRKDLSLTQENEVQKARSVLLVLQKESDSLQILNQQKVSELQKFHDQKIVLLNLIKRQEENSQNFQTQLTLLQEDLQEVSENITAEVHTNQMMCFMIKRLENEILDCKSTSHFWTQQLQQTRAEYNGLESTLRLSRHELMNEEKEVEILGKTVRGRNEQRIVKMNELQSLVLEGETSVMKIRNTMKGSIDVSLSVFVSPISHLISSQGSTRKTDDFQAFETSPKLEIPKTQEDPENLSHPEFELTKEQVPFSPSLDHSLTLLFFLFVDLPFSLHIRSMRSSRDTTLVILSLRNSTRFKVISTLRSKNKNKRKLILKIFSRNQIRNFNSLPPIDRSIRRST